MKRRAFFGGIFGAIGSLFVPKANGSSGVTRTVLTAPDGVTYHSPGRYVTIKITSVGGGGGGGVVASGTVIDGSR